MVVGLVCAAAVPLGVLGTLVDPREVLGAPVWLKPTEFAVSIAIFCVTWAWLYDQLRSRRGRTRGAFLAGTVAAVALAVEMVVIAVQAGRGTTSHVNYTSPHALQLLPLLLIAFELAAGRVARLADPRVRRDLMTTAAAGYTGLLALLTWQALHGQPLVVPDALTVAAAGVLTVLVVAGAVVALQERRPVLTPGR